MKGTLVAGRYRLDSPLGVGAMSSVWLAEDQELGRTVAVKLLGREADRARFEREARAAAALEHPNVCRLFDYGETDEGLPYMVLEHLPGGTLENRLGSPVDDGDALRIATALAAGLAHAHDRGLVHRDLKPANVLFDAVGTPKIADFGVARLAGAGTLTEAGTIVGTAAYLSPEQAAGEPATPASDVYAFGVILFRLLTGRLPFEAESPLDLVAAHRDEEPPPIVALRPDAPARLESVATAALAKRPEDRPPDGRALLAELEGAQPTLVAAPPVAAAAAGGPRGSRRAPLAALALAALALAGVGLAFVATRGTTEPARAPAATTGARTTSSEETTAPATAPAPPPSSSSTEETTSSTRETSTRSTTQTTTTQPPPPPTTTTAPPTTETTVTEPPPTETVTTTTETQPAEVTTTTG